MAIHMGEQKVYPYSDSESSPHLLRRNPSSVELQPECAIQTTLANDRYHGAQNDKEQDKNLKGPQLWREPRVNVDDRSSRRRSIRQSRRFIRCCYTFIALIGMSVLLLGVLILIVRPKLPKYTVSEGRVTSFSLSNSTSSRANISSLTSLSSSGAEQKRTVYLNAELQLWVRISNPNAMIGIDYRNIDAAFYYEGLELGKGSIPGFYQGHKNTTLVGLTMVGQHVPLSPSFGRRLRQTLADDDSLTLSSRVMVSARVKLGNWESGTCRVRIMCRLQISNPTRGGVQLLRNLCEFKLVHLSL
ncbi:hypothetical protein KP509_03G004600 [Ceratopteris richardii]|uniref:Late embryogenesis abundant protein LEA-2 subgroup domain-containing protein n=1 Tax=Ceratopteris richardii TaxID=49495 RepID=A0A8T2UWX4_CERRI|nr:hypothetical protein KP509_03G004600 [Ceratopteris richardii]